MPLVGACLLALLAGANRQLFWLATLAAFAVVWPALAPRERVGKLLVALAGILIGAAAFSFWFTRQPYTVDIDPSSLPGMVVGAPTWIILLVYQIVNLTGIALLPVTLPATIAVFLSGSMGRAGRRLLICVVPSIVFLLGLMFKTKSGRDYLASGAFGLIPEWAVPYRAGSCDLQPDQLQSAALGPAARAQYSSVSVWGSRYRAVSVPPPLANIHEP